MNEPLDDTKGNIFKRIDQAKEAAKRNGEKCFLGTPESWLEPVTFWCKNGHCSTMYIKCEASGNMCQACMTPVRIGPRVLPDLEPKKRTARQIIKSWPKWKQNIVCLWRPGKEKK